MFQKERCKIKRREKLKKVVVVLTLLELFESNEKSNVSSLVTRYSCSREAWLTRCVFNKNVAYVKQSEES
jgi:hypothetical protein